MIKKSFSLKIKYESLKQQMSLIFELNAFEIFLGGVCLNVIVNIVNFQLQFNSGTWSLKCSRVKYDVWFNIIRDLVL